MDYHQKLVDQALLTMDTYLGQFPDIKVTGPLGPLSCFGLDLVEGAGVWEKPIVQVGGDWPAVRYLLSLATV